MSYLPEPIWSWDGDRRQYRVRIELRMPDKFLAEENRLQFLSTIDEQLQIVKNKLISVGTAQDPSPED